MEYADILRRWLEPPRQAVREMALGRAPEPERSRLRLPNVPLRSLPPRQNPAYYGAAAEIETYAWGAGPTVVLVHGWGGWAVQYAAWIAPLLGAGFRVVTFDAPGHGRSSGDFASAPAFAGALRAVTDREGAPLHGVVAHSLGAIAATLAVADGVAVGRLAFLAAAVDVAPTLIALAREMGLGPEHDAPLCAYVADAFAHDVSLPGAARRAAVLPPLTLLHDPDDPETPFEDARSVAAAWPHATLVPLPRVGHQRILLAKSAIERVLGDFAV